MMKWNMLMYSKLFSISTNGLLVSNQITRKPKTSHGTSRSIVMKLLPLSKTLIKKIVRKLWSYHGNKMSQEGQKRQREADLSSCSKRRLEEVSPLLKKKLQSLKKFERESERRMNLTNLLKEAKHLLAKLRLLKEKKIQRQNQEQSQFNNKKNQNKRECYLSQRIMLTMRLETSYSTIRVNAYFT